MTFKTVFAALGVALCGFMVKAEDAAVPTLQREVVVRDASASDSSTNLTLGFSNPGFAQRFYVAWSATAKGGDTTNTWEYVNRQSDVGATEETRVVALPTGARYVCFFLQPILPNGATAVTYLQSTGVDEYVDTGFTPDSRSRADYHFKIESQSGQFMTPFGSRNGGALQFFAGSRKDNNSDVGYWFRRYGTAYLDGGVGPGCFGEHFFSLNGNTYVLDGITTTLSNPEFTCAVPAYIFAVNDNGTAGQFAKMKLFSLSIWNNEGVLVRNYVPCVDANGKAALYESVSGEIAYGSGATPLTAGGEVWSVFVGDLTKVAKAEWTNAVGDGDATKPGNWSCVNDFGIPLEGVVPGAETEVRIGSMSTITIPAGVVYGGILLGDCTLAADLDLRGHGPVQVVGTVNLDGHKLYLEQLVGGGRITESREFDLTANDASKVSSATTFQAGTASNLFNNNYARRTDATGRVLVKDEKLPMVVDYDFGEPTTIDSYRVWFGPLFDIPERGPKTWTVEGSNDGVTWTVIDSQNNIFWHGQEKKFGRIFSLAQPATYSRIRFNATAHNVGDTWLELVQLEYGRQGDFGELHVDVPAGVQTKNDSVTVDGQVRFFKDGSGTLVMGKTAQSYWSTTVNAGLVKLVAGNSAERIGRDGAEVTVAQGATLDLAGAYELTYYSFFLNGGTLTNSVTIINSSEMSLIQNVHLGADSTISFDAYGLSSKGYDRSTQVRDRAFMPTVLYLNEHVLTANAIVTYGASYLNNTYVTPGTLKLLGTWVIHDNYPFTAPGARVEVHGVFSPHAATTIGEYVDYATNTSLEFSGILTVTKLFMPNTDYFYGGTLNDGVVIDLSGRSTAWNVDSKLGGKTTQKTVKFVNGGHYTIYVKGRSLMPGDQLLVWNDGRKPANFDGLTFALDADTRRHGWFIVKGDNGISVDKGMIIFFR